MKQIKLNNEIVINIPKLVESRLLIQANSGGGKSWANRRIIEQAFGQVQIIVIDPEGEFGNMRGAYDFLYIGKDGDAPAESRSAALLVRKLLETKASAIVDIYEMNMNERRHFVRLFLEAMVNAPKELWHDCLVILDEAHKFAPEKEHSEALEAVADMASRGRKRGYCLIPATQRPAKLNKDVAAECNNKLIGRASLDIDRKRSAEELGFTTKEEIISLRNLEPGEFYVFGPAINKEVILTTIGDVKVKPPVRGQGRKKVPTPTDKVKKLLAQFKDLPSEAKKEADTLDSLRKEIQDLKRQKSTPPPVAMGVSQWMQYGEKNGYADFFKKKITEEVKKEWEKVADKWKKFYHELYYGVEGLLNHSGVPNSVESPKNVFEAGFKTTYIHPTKDKFIGVDRGQKGGDKTVAVIVKDNEITNSFEITGPEQRVLDAISWCESIGNNTPPNELVAFLSGYSHFRSTGYTNPRGYLKTKGLIDYSSGSVFLTEEGRKLASTPLRPLTQDELHRVVLDKLNGPERKLLEPLLKAYPDSISNTELCQIAGYMHERSTGYTNPRGRLRSFGLIDYSKNGVVAKPLLFIN